MFLLFIIKKHKIKLDSNYFLKILLVILTIVKRKKKNSRKTKKLSKKNMERAFLGKLTIRMFGDEG